jgi:hypothetical protein
MSHDPIDEAFKSLHQGNLLEAEKAKVKNMTYAGNELARVLDDITNSELCQLDQISRAVVIATIAKWNRAKTGQL